MLEAFLQQLLQWKSNEHYILGVFVIVALGIQHAMRSRHILICILKGCSVFFHFFS